MYFLPSNPCVYSGFHREYIKRGLHDRFVLRHSKAFAQTVWTRFFRLFRSHPDIGPPLWYILLLEFFVVQYSLRMRPHLIVYVFNDLDFLLPSRSPLQMFTLNKIILKQFKCFRF
jgi:hypothetical protein